MANNIDPNKYRKNKDIKPDSLLSNIVAIARMLLMLIGIIGMAMEFFGDDGWLKTALGKLFETTTSMMFIPVIILSVWLLNRWISSPNKSEYNKSGDFPMYVMMAAGVYYSFKWLTAGNL